MVGQRRLSRLCIAVLGLFVFASCGDEPNVTSAPMSTPTSTPTRSITMPADGTAGTAISKAEFEQPHWYAGAIFRPDGHHTVFGADGQLDALRDFIDRYVADDAAFRSIEFVQKRWSWAELQEIQMAVISDEELAAEGINVTSTGVKPEANKVEIALEEYSESAAREVLERYGDDQVFVSTTSEPPSIGD